MVAEPGIDIELFDQRGRPVVGQRVDKDARRIERVLDDKVQHLERKRVTRVTTIDGLPPGEYRVRLSKAGEVFADTRCTLPDPNGAKLAFVMEMALDSSGKERPVFKRVWEMAPKPGAAVAPPPVPTR